MGAIKKELKERRLLVVRGKKGREGLFHQLSLLRLGSGEGE
jgi:hypothetical protein